MKKTGIALLAGLVALGASAKLNGDGYYRVKNFKTDRYIYVLDDKGSLNFQATTAELGAIELWKGYEKTITDPSTIIYVKDLTGKGQDYDLQAQGTGVNAIIDYPVSIRLADSKNGTYSIFGRNSGLSRYIGDGTSSTADRGYVTSLENGEYYRWYIEPVTTDDSNYFGVNATLTDGTTYYAPFFAVFPFSFHSEGMKAYTVYDVSDGKAHIKEVTGTIPGATPVIITTKRTDASSNRLKIGGTASPVSGNLLKGAYFNNSSLLHKNQIPYDKNTMRLLGKLSNGSIGFYTANVDFVPRNQAYLVVPAGSPAELPITTEAPAIRVTGISLSKTWLSLRKGDSETLTVTVLPANADNKSLTWSSDKPEIVSVDATGKISALGLGSATITVTANDGSGVKATCSVTVTNPLATSITLDKELASVRVRQSIKLNATIAPGDAVQKVKWSSAAENIATVDSEGNVYGVSPGKVAIIAAVTDETRLYKICVVTVEPALAESITLDKQELTLTVRDTQTLTATVLPDYAGNRTVTWQSSANDVVTVTNEGLVTAVAPGSAVITATTADGSNLTASCKVTVQPALAESITLDKQNLTLTVKETQTLTATVLPDYATNRAVTWQSSANDVVTVTNEGLVTAVAPGSAVITATTTDGTNLTASCSVTVDPALVESVSLNIHELSMTIGDTQTLTATVLPDYAT
ncbi:MAG: Ig-like domain-containing protein, partial [Muribaculaceae bacterium]|nr:Ig-like domain-containing protein [Muribaculaceae bacterium]